MLKTGISAVGVALPTEALPLDELAALRGVDPDKYRIGLGCRSMAICAEGEDAVSLGRQAAQRAIDTWGGDPREIGMLAVGTESALDMSRPLSAWLAEELDLSEEVRSYEVKHACYAGTLALRQAWEWRQSGAARGRVALIVATDVALYRPEHPGEPTQGGAAVAMVVGEPTLAELHLQSYAFQRPVFDFWRAVGEPYPEVDGPLSIESYRAACNTTFGAWARDGEAPFSFAEAEAFAFHAPFPKMVRKGVDAAADALGLSAEERARSWEENVLPNLEWNREVGNCYTASTWLAFAHTLACSDATKIAALSYGSGCCAELLLFTRSEEARARAAYIKSDVEAQLAARRLLSASEYAERREQRG